MKQQNIQSNIKGNAAILEPQGFSPSAALFDFMWVANEFTGDGFWDAGVVPEHYAGAAALDMAETNGVPYVVPAGSRVYLPGTTTQRIEAADDASFDITGDIEVWCRYRGEWSDVTTGDGSDNAFIARWRTFGARTWMLFGDGAGNLSFTWVQADGTQQTESIAFGPALDGDILWVRATLDVDNGAGAYVVRFYLTALENPTSAAPDWLLIGTETGASTTDIRANTTVINVGTGGAGQDNNTQGEFFRGKVYDGLAGTLVCDFISTMFDPSTRTTGQSEADSEGITWTIPGTAGTVRTAALGQPNQDTIMCGDQLATTTAWATSVDTALLKMPVGMEEFCIVYVGQSISGTAGTDSSAGLINQGTAAAVIASPSKGELTGTLTDDVPVTLAPKLDDVPSGDNYANGDITVFAVGIDANGDAYVTMTPNVAGNTITEPSAALIDLIAVAGWTAVISFLALSGTCFAMGIKWGVAYKTDADLDAIRTTIMAGVPPYAL